MESFTSTLVGMLAFPCAIVMMLVAMLIARRLEPTRRLKSTAAGLAVCGGLCSLGFLLAMKANTNLSWFPWAMWSMTALYVGGGLWFGIQERTRTDERKTSALASLKGWQQLLAIDRAGIKEPAILAQELEKIGDIYWNDLQQKDEGLAAYAEAYELYSKGLLHHPLQLGLLGKYHRALLKSGNQTKAAEVAEHWEKVALLWRHLKGEE